MKTTLACSIAVAVMSFASLAAADEGPVTVKASHSVIISVTDAQNAVVDDTSIADARLIGSKELLVVGLKEGKTEIRLTTTKAPVVIPVTVLSQTATWAPPPSDATVILVQIGKSVTLTDKGLARVAIGDPDVADIEVGPAGLSIKGMTQGSTTLIRWYEDGRRLVCQIQVTQ